MGNKLFGIDIAKLINDNVGSGLLDATLIVWTAGTRSSSQPTSGTTPTSVSHGCKGFVDSQATKNLKGTSAADGTKVIVLIGDSINNGNMVPGLKDNVTIEGATYSIEKIDRDPAAATYSLQARPT